MAEVDTHFSFTIFAMIHFKTACPLWLQFGVLNIASTFFNTTTICCMKTLQGFDWRINLPASTL